MPLEVGWPQIAPDVVGLDQVTAEATLSALSIPFVYVDPQDSDIAAGSVMLQDPVAGATMNLLLDDTPPTMTLTLSTGIARLAVQITISSQLSRNQIAEKSAFHAFVNFYDDSTYPWVLTAPTTIQYRVDCESTGTTVRDWTSLTPAAYTNLTITSSDNAIICDSNRTERKVLTVMGDSGLDSQESKAFRWNVMNLQGQY